MLGGNTKNLVRLESIELVPKCTLKLEDFCDLNLASEMKFGF